MSEHSYSADTEVSRLDGELLAAGRTIAELEKRIGELEAERDEARNRNSAHPSSSGNEPERDDKK